VENLAMMVCVLTLYILLLSLGHRVPLGCAVGRKMCSGMEDVHWDGKCAVGWKGIKGKCAIYYKT